MREIKFRAWDKSNREMIDNIVIYQGEVYMNTNPLEQFPLNAELIQYTGLHDKNGKEIYEGDIVSVKWEKNANLAPEYNWNWLTKTMAIQYCFGGWRLYVPHKQMNYPLLFETPSLSIEVIGNIYENPELLKGGTPNEK